MSDVRGELTIRTKKFPPMPGEADELINEGLYGKALGLHLRKELAARGIETEEPAVEDWGWYLNVRDAPVSSFIGIGRLDDDELVVFIEPKRDRVFRWYRFVDVRPLRQRLTHALIEIFTADPEIELDPP